MERKTDKDAFKTLKFREVVYPEDVAIGMLTERTRAAVKTNIDTLIQKMLDARSDDPEFLSRLRNIADNTEKSIGRGGFSFSEKELLGIYEKMGVKTYSEVVDYYTHDGIEAILADKPFRRNPGPTIMGYLLDLSAIVKDDIASYEERVKVIADSLRDADVSPFFIGAIVDDSFHLRGTPIMPIEFMVDRKEVVKFADHFIKTLNPQELVEFNIGLAITLEEMQLASTGFSTN